VVLIVLPLPQQSTTKFGNVALKIYRTPICGSDGCTNGNLCANHVVTSTATRPAGSWHFFCAARPKRPHLLKLASGYALNAIRLLVVLGRDDGYVHIKATPARGGGRRPWHQDCGFPGNAAKLKDHGHWTPPNPTTFYPVSTETQKPRAPNPSKPYHFLSLRSCYHCDGGETGRLGSQAIKKDVQDARSHNYWHKRRSSSPSQ
jgi:hypothetical protein